MFCKKCGTQLREGAAFCQNCGAPTGVQPGQPVPPQPGVTTPPQPPVNPPKGTGRVKGPITAKRVGIVLAALVVVGIVVGVVSCSSGSGYSSADKALAQVGKGFETIYSAEDEDDVIKGSKQVIKAMPSKAVSALNDERDYDDDENVLIDQLSHGSYDAGDLIDDVEDMWEYLEYYYDIDADDVEISFELERGDRLDSDDVADIEDELDDLGVDMEIDAAYEIDATLIVTYDGDDEEMSMGSMSPLVLIKVNDTWYVWFDYLTY